jgi:shikimate kinase
MDSATRALGSNALYDYCTFGEGVEMKGTGQAVAYGAVSILNALSTGKGGALSIDLSTRAKVVLRDGRGPILYDNGHPESSTNLAPLVASKVLEYYGYAGKVHGKVQTSSNIPEAVGLKSSSAAANAVALATASALDEQVQDANLLRIGMEACIEFGVSLTGAFDDAIASFHGGANITDNKNRVIEKTLEIPDDVKICVLVSSPRESAIGLEPSKYSSIKRIMELAYNEALNGQIWDALTLNGIAYSSILGRDSRPALSAIEAGALGAGLSGKGPAITAVAAPEVSERVRKALKIFNGQLIETRPNFNKASIEL